MAISRPFLLALLGAVLLGATFVAVQSSRDSADDDAAPAAQQAHPAEQAAAPAAPAEPAPAEPAALTAEEALQAITSPGTRVTAGRFDFEFDGREVRGGREHDHFEVTGSFECGCKADLPKFDLTYRSHDESGYGDRGEDVNLRAVSTGDEGFIGEAGSDTLYRIDPEAMSNLSRLRAAVAGGTITAVPDFDVSRWVPNARVVGTEEMDGVETTHVRGAVAARSVGTDIVRLLQSDAERSQVDVPPNAVRTAKRVVKRAQFEAWVGSDRVVRRMELRLRVRNAPPPLREANDAPVANFRFSFGLSQVNKSQGIDTPADAANTAPAEGMGRGAADEARDGFMVASMLLNSPAGFAGTTLVFARLAQSSDEGEGARKAAKAVADGKKVVILFQNPDGLDDRAMRGVMRQLDARTRAVVLTDDVEAVERYGSLVEDLGVSQTPAVVLIDSRGEARLIEGYIDTDTLAQAVADAR
jgi:hypothetical protein